MNDAQRMGRSLAEVDPAVADALMHETARQQDYLELIASENFTSEAILLPSMISGWTLLSVVWSESLVEGEGGFEFMRYFFNLQWSTMLVTNANTIVTE